MSKLVPIEVKGFVILGHEGADLDMLKGNVQKDWEFFEDDTGELHARWIGDEQVDEVELVWYGGKEQYWGVVEMDPARWEVIDNEWRRR